MGLKGVAIDSAGNIYITDPHDGVVWEVNNGTGVISVLPVISSPATLLHARMRRRWLGDQRGNFPLSHARWLTDGSGNIFITDPVANRIRKVSDGTISTVAGTGTAGYSGDGGLATAAEFRPPSFRRCG